MRPFLTRLRLLFHVLGALWTTTALYPFYDEAKRRRYVQGWSKKLLDICGVEVKVHHPEKLSSKALIVANHISWLDIFLIHSVTPCHFIAKAEMAHWPIIGSLAKRTGTLFLERRSVRHLKSTLETLVNYLKAREHCIFFPEGTTAKQGELLPFHPNLFESAIHAEMPVQPIALKYVNDAGEFEDAVDLSGDISMNESVNSILGKERIFAELTLLPLIDSNGLNRKDLSEHARKAIISVLHKSVQENRDMPPETRHDRQGVQR